MKKIILLACSLFIGAGGFAQSVNDAGITGITAPISPVQPNTSLPISVTVKNFGTSPLVSATLGFSVNGVVQPTFAWSGNLATNATSAAVTLGNFTFSPGNHTVKAWSKLPNTVADGNATNDTTTISILTCTVLSGNYTINKNAAATATNFTSFTSAVAALKNCGVSGPVTITVAPNTGPYNEQVILPVISGTSAANTVTFEGNNNTVFGAGNGSNQGVITFNGADYVKINNLKIVSDPVATSSTGVYFINASDYDIISNCTVDVGVSSVYMNVNGISAGTFGGNNASNLLLQNNIVIGGTYGILISGTTTTTNNRIIGNQVRDSRAYGIYIYDGGTGTIIEGNDISRPNRVNTQGFYAIGLQGTTISTQIRKNRIHNTHGKAASTLTVVRGIYTAAVAPAGSENIVSNNVMYNINNIGGPFYAFANEGGSGTHYFHNTIAANDPALSYTTLQGLSISVVAANIKFINNILAMSAPAVTAHLIYVSSAATGLECNYNDLLVGSIGHYGYFLGNCPTLASWRAVNNFAYDQNSISADPLFVSATYLQPFAAALNNTGKPLPAVTDDINGVTRSTTTPDMGAYEFSPVMNDVGVTAIVSPVSPVAPAVSQSVQVMLRNFGAANLTSATIGWSVNGIAQTNFAWTGQLNSLTTTTTPVTIGNYTFPAGNFTMKVWAKLPNGAPDGLAANDTTILNVVSCAPMTGNYTINKNNPTAGTNFQSISAAAARLNSCGVSGPVSITVVSATGPYNEQVIFGNIPYTSATNTVTFEGSGNTVSATPGTKFGTFVLDGTDHVKLNNFIITLNPGVTAGWGVQLVNAADHNTISNNTINLPAAANVASLSGIAAGADLFSKGNNTSFTKIQNNIINGGGIGIKILGNSGGLNTTSNEITGNQVRNSYYTAISVNDANGTLVEGNDISRPTLTATGNFTGIEVWGLCVSTIISKNRIHNTHDAALPTTTNVYGIYIQSETAVGNENIIKNNVIYNINNPGGSLIGLYNGLANGAYYYHNTITSVPGQNYDMLRGIHFTTASTNVKFINNIVSLPSTASAKYAIYLTVPAISLVSNNNDLDIGSTGDIGYYSGPRTTLANWKAVNNNAYDQNSVTADPQFVSVGTGNLQPTTVGTNNLGQPLAAVTDDILGAARNNTTPDFGAYEFGVAANDVGIVAVSVPVTNGCGHLVSDSVTVTIRNFGTNTQTSIPVSYALNGTSIPTPETFTGSLAPNTTADYTFKTKANLSAPNTYEIIARTILFGDIITGNNPDTLTVTNSLIPNIPVVLNFETPTTGISRFRKVDRSHSNIMESPDASNGAGSAKGLIMDGVDNSNWVSPTGVTNPWTNNANNFGAAYICISPAGGLPSDSLIMTFDLKQLFKVANVNTNFRVTVNGTQVGPTYRPPFTGVPIIWQKVKVNLTPYKNNAFVTIGLESSVKEAFANGTGTANLIDNIEIKRKAGPTGLKENDLSAQVKIYPNPSTGTFNIDLPKGKTYQLEVTDLTGKVLLKKATKSSSQLSLENTAKGIYLLKISGDNGAAVRKLIVE